MARTALFSVVRKALATGPVPRAITRRQALAFGAAATVAACTPPGRGPDIGIVGGGVAGLTAAYRLAKDGRRVTLYEASGRFGGRMFTKRAFNAEGMFCELGGELVDSDHLPLIHLARELGVGIQRLKPEHGDVEDIYDIDGPLKCERDMLQAGKGAFLPMAQTIARDQAALTDAQGNWTARARELDGISLSGYLNQFRGGTADWAVDLIALAYWGEYGIPNDQQSSLNLVDFITTGPDFAMFGKSDEIYRVAGGSSALPDALLTNLQGRATIKPGHRLAALGRDGDGVTLHFATRNGPMTATHDIIVLAIPFSVLRGTEGIDALGLSPPKLKAIRELGYGDNAKVMIGTTGRPWTTVGKALPAPSDGEFYSKDFQVVWDTSRGQKGARGILTNYLTGVENQAAAIAGMQKGLRAILPAIADSLDPSNVASAFWAKNPLALGSFAAAKVGQYTTLLEVCGTPELDGRLHFAGEHTSIDYLGFMCGGVDSGERAAREIIAQTTPKTA